MTRPLDYRGRWQSERHVWKKAVSRSQDLSRGAKYLAVLICDNYANSKTACCWPSNRTLAELMGVNIRTIQRHMAELVRLGWSREVRIQRRRRAFQLVFPRLLERDREHDSAFRPEMTPLTPKDDSRVAPYIEPKKEPRMGGQKLASTAPHAYVSVRASETEPLRQWQAWLAENTDHDWDGLLPDLTRGDCVNLPSRYPRDRPEDTARYIRFFDEVRKSGSRMFQ